MIPLSNEGTSMFSRPLRLLVALSLCVSTPVWAQAPAAKARSTAKPVTVNGKPIPKSRLDFIVKQRAAQGQADNEQARKAILDNLITQEVVAQEAERRGFAKSADVRAQLELLRQQALVQAVVQDHLKTHPVKDEEMLAEYNRVRASRGDKEYKARHILVDKDTEANGIIRAPSSSPSPRRSPSWKKGNTRKRRYRPSSAGTSSSSTTSAPRNFRRSTPSGSSS